MSLVYYRPCRDCESGKHTINQTSEPVQAMCETDDGEQKPVTIPGNTVYLRVGKRCYLPTFDRGDTIPDEHDKTLTELWQEHGLMPLEWAVPYG